MAQIRPFPALLPPGQLAARICCPPYDVVTTKEAREYLQNNPHSFMRVIRAEAEFEDETDAYDQKVYARAHENLVSFQRAGWLRRQHSPGLFVYRMREGDHTQTGVVACCAIDEYDSGIICRHENTKPDKENDRTQHALALSAHAEPVLLAYRGEAEIDELVETICRPQPLLDFLAEDGVQHSLWPVPEQAVGNDFEASRMRVSDTTTKLIEAFAGVRRLYIADGHHRSASASRVRTELRAKNAKHSGTEGYNFFPAVLFPAQQLRILAYNRVLRRLAPWHPEDFLNRIRSEFDIIEDSKAIPSQKGTVGIYFAGRWRSLLLRAEPVNDALLQLDLSRLQKQLLEPFFGIVDQRSDSRIDFVGGKNGVSIIQQLVDSGAAQLGFSLFPPTLHELFEISDQGRLMPPKSTWFEPKLRSGLFVHVFN